MPPQAPGAYKSQVNTNPSTFFFNCSDEMAMFQWKFLERLMATIFLLAHPSQFGGFSQENRRPNKKGQIPGPFVRVSCPNTDSLKKASWLGCRECNLNIWSMKKFTHIYIPQSSSPAFFQALALSPVFLNLGNGFRPWFQNQTLPIR